MAENLIKKISKGILPFVLSAIAITSAINFATVSYSIKRNPEFNRTSYERELDKFAASFPDEDIIKKKIGTENTQRIFDITLFYPGTPGRYLAYWVYDK